MEKKHFHFNSSDGEHRIHGILWKPSDKTPIGVLQIMHGMDEYIDRYDAFARFMCDHGFAVAGEDHLGHGLSVNSKEELGYFGKKHGMDYILQDNYRVKKHMEQEFKGIPYFILGHSMGSFIGRKFISEYSQELDGAIIMGTGNQPALLAELGKIASAAIAAVKGWTYRSAFVNNLAFGSYNKKFKPSRTAHDWLTKDEAIVDAYEADELCMFMFTLAAYRDLFDLVIDIGKQETIRKTVPSLPIYITSGKEDPVGGFGLGVYEVFDKFKLCGLEDVEIKLYDKGRHEILNETDRETVYEDLLKWLCLQIKKKSEEAGQ